MISKKRDKRLFCNVSFEATKDFRDEIKSKAKSKGMNQSQYIRECIYKDMRE